MIINSTVGQALLPGILTGARFYVDTASDTRQGLHRLETGLYDIVVAVENRSPENWQLCRSIRRLTDVPLIVISANASPEACAKAIDAGADYFLRKSFGPRELAARAEALLKRRALHPAAPRRAAAVSV